jgi:hypothetical protein
LKSAWGAFPELDAVLLAGSAATRRRRIASDIDLIVLTNEVEPGAVEEAQVSAGQHQVDIAAYHSSHFLAVASVPALAFFNLREIRKLLHSIPLFDKGCAAASKEALSKCTLPTEWLRNLADRVQLARKGFDEGSPYSLKFLSSVEDLIIARMHLEIGIRYSKHKYLLDDAHELPTASLARLLSGTARSLEKRAYWPALASDLQTFFAASDRVPPLVEKVLADCRALIEAGCHLEAVLPFRHVLVRSAHFFGARRPQEFQLILRRGITQERVGPSILCDFDAVLNEVHAAVSTRTPGLSLSQQLPRQ